jgi:hypothetical protein
MYCCIGEEEVLARDEGISAQTSTAACWPSLSTCFNATRTLFFSHASLDRYSPVLRTEDSGQNGPNLRTVKFAIPSHGMWPFVVQQKQPLSTASVSWLE